MGGGLVMLPIKAIHPETRIEPWPSNGVPVDCNPPSLLWPTDKGASVRYTVRLSQSARFPQKRTVSDAGLPWAMYTPSDALEAGQWYWQVGVSKKGGIKWSDTHTFCVEPKSRLRKLPSADDLLETAGAARPRLMPPASDFRRNRTPGSRALAERLYRETSHLIGQDIPDDTHPPKQGDTEYQQFKFDRWRSKRLAAGQVKAVEGLMCAHLLIDDDRYIKEAIRRAVNIATWDPDGFTNEIISDFADASCVRAMAMVYDGAWERLSGKERKQLRKALVARCRRFFENAFNKVEARLFGAHLWQHLLTEFFEGAVALLGDVPEARSWCRYIYELWVARFPLIAGDDGAWANGPKYFGTNVETLILMSRYFDQFGAKGFDDQPWFRNASGFLQYAWPPGSENDGFGDGTELEAKPSANHLHWVAYLGHRFSDHDALDYVAAWQKAGASGNVSPRLALLSLGWKKPSKRKRKPQPKARLFRDTGLVSCHTDRERPDRNLMLAFRSSPFGSFNHMHSCQNAFNLLYGGERLLANSGYYVAMADPHAKQWYRDTRGHNTIRIDGTSQKRSSEGFGWIPRFIDGERVTYWMGDASNAYGDAGLIRFRRHVAVLHPGIVVIYDDLEADHDATWSWQLHAHRKLSFRHRDARFTARNSKGEANAAFTASTGYTVDIGDTFDPPAVNWGDKTYQGKTVETFPKRWHATVRTVPARFARFLTVISVGKRPTDIRPSPDGACRIGHWNIEADMDANSPASIQIVNTRAKTCLAVDTASIEFGDRKYRAPDASILIEDGRPVRSRDTLPAAAEKLISGR